MKVRNRISGFRGGYFNALDASLSEREAKLRRAAEYIGAGHGDKISSIPEPVRPTKVEEKYLAAIESFAQGRMVRGFDLLDLGDHIALKRYGRLILKRQ